MRFCNSQYCNLHNLAFTEIAVIFKQILILKIYLNIYLSADHLLKSMYEFAQLLY